MNVQGRDGQELVAEWLDFGLRHGAIDSDRRPIARRIVKEAVRQLLSRKRLTPDEEARLRQRWGEYAS